MEPFYLGEQVFELSHLADHREYTNALLGKNHKRVLIEISYSCHCWSRSPVDGEDIPKDRHVPDGSKVSPRNRIFCEQRHELSKELPAAIKEMLAGDGHVSKTPEQNILRVDKAIPILATDDLMN